MYPLHKCQQSDRSICCQAIEALALPNHRDVCTDYLASKQSHGVNQANTSTDASPLLGPSPCLSRLAFSMVTQRTRKPSIFNTYLYARSIRLHTTSITPSVWLMSNHGLLTVHVIRSTNICPPHQQKHRSPTLPHHQPIHPSINLMAFFRSCRRSIRVANDDI